MSGENPVTLISIHAPAGGASSLGDTLAGIGVISIHAPAGGASIDANADMIVQQFQFTPLREGLREKRDY